MQYNDLQRTVNCPFTRVSPKGNISSFTLMVMGEWNCSSWERITRCILTMLNGVRVEAPGMSTR